MSSPMAAMLATSSGRRCARSANGRLKSSRGPARRKASRCCPAAGWSRGPSHGWAATVASPRTSNRPSHRQPHGSSSPRYNSSLAASQGYEIMNDNFESDSQADQWQRYIHAKLSAALSKRSSWFLFGLAFLAVYREVFETILFYAALASQGSGGAVFGGFVTGLVLLAVNAWAMQIGKGNI